MIERSDLIELAKIIGAIILGLILILCAFAFIGLCAAVAVVTAFRVAAMDGGKIRRDQR
jgi:predicted membrane protein